MYQKVKDTLNKRNRTIRKLIDDLKKEKGFGWVESNVTGNQTNLFLNMTKEDSQGNFVFVNPNTLQGAERRFLEYALEIINADRHKNQPAA